MTERGVINFRKHQISERKQEKGRKKTSEGRKGTPLDGTQTYRAMSLRTMGVVRQENGWVVGSASHTEEWQVREHGGCGGSKSKSTYEHEGQHFSRFFVTLASIHKKK